MAPLKVRQALADASLAPPADRLDDRHQAQLDDFNARDTVAFDQAYVDVQYTVHRETVDLCQAYGERGGDGRTKQFALELLPTLRAHLDHVTRLHGASDAG